MCQAAGADAPQSTTGSQTRCGCRFARTHPARNERSRVGGALHEWNGRVCQAAGADAPQSTTGSPTRCVCRFARTHPTRMAPPNRLRLLQIRSIPRNAAAVSRPVFLDHHSTTPVDPQVLDAMLPYFREQFGNASSINHEYGTEAAEAVARARNQVASLVGAERTRSDLHQRRHRGQQPGYQGRSSTQPAMRPTSSRLRQNTARSSIPRNDCAGRVSTSRFLPVDEFGRLAPDHVVAAIQPATALVFADMGE